MKRVGARGIPLAPFFIFPLAIHCAATYSTPMLLKRNSPQYVSEWRLITLGMTIPLLLGLGPVIGFYLGFWIGRFFGFPTPGGFIGLLIGFAAGIRETVGIVKRLIALTDNKKK
ncbi:TPA: hypothetical protein DDW35_08685 [Candidatus Sumerlaeota bacterium]|jgi:hypothetical protein|nr:hypothetical protein [Candidatus Sumerlaeota bacterium]